MFNYKSGKKSWSLMKVMGGWKFWLCLYFDYDIVNDDDITMWLMLIINLSENQGNDSNVTTGFSLLKVSH